MRLVVVASLMLILLLAVTPAVASWGPFISLGPTNVNADLSCASPMAGEAVCAARALNNTLLVNHFSASSWSGWTSLAGVVTSAPSCASDSGGQVICATRSTGGGMAVTTFNGTTWSAKTMVAGTLTSGPSCATLAPGKVLCAARAVTGGMAFSVFNGTKWSAFAILAASTTSAPGCTSDDAGGVICAILDTSSNVLVNRYNGTAWQGFLNIGGRGTGDPICTNLDVAGQVACFARGSDSAFWSNRFHAGGWLVGQWDTNWSSLGGLVTAKGSCAVVTTNQVACGVSALTDSALWLNDFNGTAWSGFTRLGQTTVGNPSCTSLGGGSVLCAVVGVNGKASSTVGP